MIRVLLADDQAMFRSGIRRLLEHESDIEVVGEAQHGREAIDAYRVLAPHVLVLDVSMPGKDGLDTTKELLVEAPAAKILILSVHESLGYAWRLLRAGARGYLEKSRTPEVLVAAVRAVAAGERFVSPELAVTLTGAFLDTGGFENTPDGLSDREFQVMRLLAAGATNREIAASLHLSIKTVDTHRANVLKKLGLRNNADLARFALLHGYIEK